MRDAFSQKEFKKEFGGVRNPRFEKWKAELNLGELGDFRIGPAPDCITFAPKAQLEMKDIGPAAAVLFGHVESAQGYPDTFFSRWAKGHGEQIAEAYGDFTWGRIAKRFVRGIVLSLLIGSQGSFAGKGFYYERGHANSGKGGRIQPLFDLELLLASIPHDPIPLFSGLGAWKDGVFYPDCPFEVSDAKLALDILISLSSGKPPVIEAAANPTRFREWAQIECGQGRVKASEFYWYKGCFMALCSKLAVHFPSEDEEREPYFLPPDGLWDTPEQEMRIYAARLMESVPSPVK